MNKIQKVLWSIFSGLICIIYKSDYYAHASFSFETNDLWMSTSNCPCSTGSCIDCLRDISGNTGKNNITIPAALTKNPNANYISKDIIYIVDPSIVSYTAVQGQTETDTLCGKGYYYKCDSTTLAMSGCCSKCPTPIAGTDDKEVFYEYTKYNIYPTINNSSHSSVIYINIRSDKDIFGNLLDATYMQIYKSRPLHRADKDIAASGCKLKIVKLTNDNSNNEYTDGEHYDNTGTYKYTQGDECSYEKQD